VVFLYYYTDNNNICGNAPMNENQHNTAPVYSLYYSQSASQHEQNW
jgi:hypothetical protein